MAALTAAQIESCWHDYAERVLAKAGPVALNKQDLKDAVVTFNTWLDVNQASAVVALATGAANFNSVATNNQKILLLIYVLMTRLNQPTDRL